MANWTMVSRIRGKIGFSSREQSKPVRQAISSSPCRHLSAMSSWRTGERFSSSDRPLSRRRQYIYLRKHPPTHPLSCNPQPILEVQPHQLSSYSRFLVWIFLSWIPRTLARISSERASERANARFSIFFEKKSDRSFLSLSFSLFFRLCCEYSQ